MAQPGLGIGKLPPELLRRLVLGRLGVSRPETLIGAALGVDAAAVDVDGWACVLKLDPVTTATAGAGRLAVIVACNDLAATAAEPLGVLPTLLFPAEVHPSEIDRLTNEIDTAARDLNVEVLGGHTEISPGLGAPLIVMTAVGRARPDRLLMSAGARPGDALVLTKAAALEGTSILAHDFADRLDGQVAESLLEEARGYRSEVSVVPDGLAAAELGARDMHDPTEGGVIGALWEMAEASGSGFRVRETSIPVRPATRAICSTLGIDPLRLISSGALLIACPDGRSMVRGLVGRGVPATSIGEVTSEGREIIGPDGHVDVIETDTRDELYRFLEAVASDRVAHGAHPTAAVDRPPPGDWPTATASDAASTDDGSC